MKVLSICVCLFMCCIALTEMSFGQLTIGAQLRTRTELRDGHGSPLPKSAAPGFFTSQRARLNLGFKTYRIKFGLSLQDVRVWGQDVSTINRTTTADNNALMLHEAWGEIALTDTILKNKTLSLKIGRQELVYDDQRLLGNLDWLQQARRHDAAVLKYETPKWNIHLAAAFNQNRENNTGTVYNGSAGGNYAANTNGGAMYKSMQFLYAGRKLKSGNVSLLFFADQFGKYRMDTVNTIAVKTYQTGSWGRATTGIYYTNVNNKLTTTASAYYQFGKTSASQKLGAYLLSGSLQYALSKKFLATAGVDYTSGGTTGTTNKAFDPLYGTPHKFWGLMDYFYAASPFGQNGLTDYYLKTKFISSDKLWIAADLHRFNSAATVYGYENQNFGHELDLVSNYSLTKQINIEGGYSHFFATTLLSSKAVKNVSNGQKNNNWAYLMINIRPDFLFK